ncbi:MAG: YjbQ family protein [Candidatus Saganbacteria bacterium]|nr:YjbQ family protein [Candidatus Saganbacteria bacterium]
MMIRTKRIALETKGRDQVIDLTAKVEQAVAETKIKAGLATVFVPGSTASITTIEYEPGLIADIKELGERLAPAGKTYEHDQAWHDGNGYSHLRAAVIGPSLSIPVENGALTLGTWQQIVLIDHDNRPRNREVVIQLIGE